MLTSVVQVAYNSSREQQGRAGSRFRLPVALFISLPPHSQIGTQPLVYGSAIRNRRSDQDRRPERTKRVEGPLCRALPWRPWRLIYGSAIRNSTNLPGFSDMQNSNRRRIAYFSYDSARRLAALEPRRRISNSNSRHFRNLSNSRKNNTYVISNSNKTRYSWNPEISILSALDFSARAFRFP